MQSKETQNNGTEELALITGATGKTGRRVVERLRKLERPVRLGSRGASPSFDWNHQPGWEACLEGVTAAYLVYSPDLAVPGAGDAIAAFVSKAREAGVRRLVLLSGRGEEEAQACEKLVMDSGLEWTIVRASWFNQNFSEGAFVDMVREGTIALPAGDVQEPFVDVDDISDVVAAALTESGHNEQVYEVTGPRLMTLTEAAADISKVCDRTIEYRQIPHRAFVDGVAESGAPEQVVWMMDYLFSTVLDGRNAYLTDGVRRALGRPPKDFSAYAAETAASGVWETDA